MNCRTRRISLSARGKQNGQLNEGAVDLIAADRAIFRKKISPISLYHK